MVICFKYLKEKLYIPAIAILNPLPEPEHQLDKPEKIQGPRDLREGYRPKGNLKGS